MLFLSWYALSELTWLQIWLNLPLNLEHSRNPINVSGMNGVDKHPNAGYNTGCSSYYNCGLFFIFFWEIGLEILRAILHMNQTQIFVLCGHSILNSLFPRLLLSTFMLEVGGGGGEEEYIILYFLSPFSPQYCFLCLLWPNCLFSPISYVL